MFKTVRMGSYAIGNDDDGVCKESWTLKTSKTELTERADFINNFSEPPSLQRIAVLSIAIGLWTAPDIRNEMASAFLYDIKIIVELERRILDKLSNSSLPTSLKTEISYVIRPIKLQLWEALRSYRTGYQRNLKEYYIKHGTIYWTVEGTVDKVKSLTELFDNESLDSGHLYEIACCHCLGEYATNLWEKIPEEFRNRFRITRIEDLESLGYYHDLIIYWTCVLENSLGSFLPRLIDHENIYDDKLSIDVNMIVKYFWKKLSEQEKNNHLSKWLLQATQQCMEFESDSFYQYSSEFFDVLCFLLSHVNRKTQMTEFFRNHSRVLVLLFESWPYQRIFLSTIFELLDNLPEDIYSCIMQNISSKMSKMGNEMMIFKEIWSVSPLRLRRSFLKNDLLCEEVLLQLLELENLNLAVRILNDASEEESEQFICLMFNWPEFKRAIYSNNLNSLHMLLSKSTLPPECYPYKRNVLEQREFDTLMTSWFIEYGDWHICIEWICDGHMEAAESFFRWACQSESPETFKEVIPGPNNIYLTLIFLSKYEHVDQFMNCFFETREEIQHFKADFLRGSDNYFFKQLIAMPFIASKREVDVLQKFINYNLSSLENIAEFRLICRSCIEYALGKGVFESATLLLNTSFDSIDEAKRYKNEIILSEKRIKKFLLLNESLTDDDWNHAKEIVLWSSPLTLNTVTKIKSLILEQKTSYSFQSELNSHTSALLDLLKNVVEKDSR